MTHPPLRRFSMLLGALCLCAGLWWFRGHGGLPGDAPRPTRTAADERLARSLAGLMARERQIDQTIWRPERRAETCGAMFESLWDQINRATNKFAPLAALAFGELALPRFAPPQALPHAIAQFTPAGAGPVLSPNQWGDWLTEWERAGWQVEQVEFRHRRFDTDAQGEPMQSQVYFRADVVHSAPEQHATLEGDLVIGWDPHGPGTDPTIRRIDARGVLVRQRGGPLPFRPVLLQAIQPPEHWLFIDPLILYDLDGDGLSEIILPASNQLFRRRGPDQFAAEPLCQHPLDRIHTAVIADFDGDGQADLLCATSAGLFLFSGSPAGTFEAPARMVWAATPPLRYAQVLTCGDFDEDGHLDVFLAQYKSPYHHGQMPGPYYDANDGDPAYLLHNDGHGYFADVTRGSGLEAKRCRRTYSASFARLEGEQHLALLVVSDFAGIELYRNDGRGHFTEATHPAIPEPVGLGMAHALSDFNSDGRLDVLMIGMDSPTVDRLQHLGLWRCDVAEDRSMRPRLAEGNRLFLGQAQGGFASAPGNADLARSGWSWGCGAADFDNDGFPDLFIANGHETRLSVRDYEPEYWLHDIYVGRSQDDPAVAAYFREKYARTRGRGFSYGGYEKKRFYFNDGGRAYREAGYLMGVALEQDGRNVVADDLDGDGRMDLLVTTFELWPETRQTLRIFHNSLPDAGNWIGFRLREKAGGPSPVGARVRIHYGGRWAVREIVTGDSLRSQSANTLHFGLGQAAAVDQAEILWANGQRQVIERPEVNRYHDVR